MEMYIPVFLGVAVSYLIGSIPTAFIVGKAHGLDIREHGSGNVGATNVYRVVGKAWGILSLILDALKGFIPVFFAPYLIEQAALPADQLQMIFGVTAILGHMFPVWLKFRGGKGVATGLGVMLGLIPAPTLSALGIFIVTVALSRMVSLGSILAAASLVALYPVFYSVEATLPRFIFVGIIVLFIIFKHKANIRRIIRGEELKISFKKSKPEEETK